MEKLLTTKQIAEEYGVTPYTITQNWCNKGLKFIRGKNSLLFKISWVEKFLEEEADRQSKSKNVNSFKMVVNKTIKANICKATFNKEMKIV